MAVDGFTLFGSLLWKKNIQNNVSACFYETFTNYNRPRCTDTGETDQERRKDENES
jgi:hypothetical protein